MTDQADTPDPIAHRRQGGHWLVFGTMYRLAGPVVGCHCGFRADTDADNGWGDSVLDHFEAVIRAETAAEVRALRAENEASAALIGGLRDTQADLLAERNSALAELAAARDREAERQAVVDAAVTFCANSGAVRMADGELSYFTGDPRPLRAALAALSQSEPTKETP